MPQTYSFEIGRKKDISRGIELLLSLACIFSNLSQIPFRPIAVFTKNAALASWIAILAYIALRSFSEISIKKLVYFIPLVVFDVLILIFQIFSKNNYLGLNLLYPVHLSALICIVSYVSGQFLTEKSFKKIMNFYILSALVTALYVYCAVFSGYSSFATPSFIYVSKNSLAQIVLYAFAGVVVCGFFDKKFLKWMLCLFFTVFIFMLKSRAVIVGFFLIVVYLIFTMKKNFLVKFITVLIAIVAVVSLFTVPQFYDLVIDSIILGGRAKGGIDAISSGRVTHFAYFAELFSKSPLLGNGDVYIESFPLTAIACTGIFASIAIIIFALVPLFCYFKTEKTERQTPISIMLILLTIITLSNSLFEELAPFGPGVKCYLLWVVTGLSMGFREKRENGWGLYDNGDDI